MKKSQIAQFISVILKIMLILGTACLFFIPRLYNLFSEVKFLSQTIYYMIAFYLCAILSLGIIYELIKIFDVVYKGSPFKKSIEIGLKKIAILFMVLAIIIIVKIIFIPTIISVAISFITFIVSLSFYVLSQIFKVAIEYKNEIDLMI